MGRPRKRHRTGESHDKSSGTDHAISDIPNASPVKQHRQRSHKLKTVTTPISGVPEADIDAISGAKNKSSWQIASIGGGTFKARSIFSRDEKYLFAATDKILKVLSTNSGQSIRSIASVQGGNSITDFALDPFNEFRILIAYDNAMICSFDWTDGLLIAQFSIPETPKQLVALGNSALLLLCRTQLLACTLPLSSQTPGIVTKIHTQAVLDLGSVDGNKMNGNEINANGIKGNKVNDNDRLIAVDNGTASVCFALGNQIWFARDRIDDSNFSQCQFTWKKFTMASQITSIACFGDTLAVGERTGYIRIYVAAFGSGWTDQLPIGTVINWHQSPVTLLEISNNGLYLLSGAAEEVLLISQINTGHRQFVPRLGAELVGLGQTTSGSLYSVSLSNNIIKIIDAADLELVSEISGIHSISPPVTSSTRLYTPPVALLQPHREQLYINGSNLSRGTLQGYDIWQDQQTQRIDVARITRTKLVGSENKPVFEPTVNFASFTSDGSWLATIDEWDNHYALDEHDPLEIFLKFWTWREKEWHVVTKIESPHGIRCHLLGLASPKNIGSAKPEFASLGADGSVKIWRLLKSSSTHSSETLWSLYRTIGSNQSSLQPNGALVYSPDGSILLVGIGGEIFVVSISTIGIVKCLQVGNSVSQLQIIGRYAMCLHDRSSLFSGWDIATGRVVFSERLDRQYSMIAVNESLQTFAISNATLSAKSTIVISRIISDMKVDVARISLDSHVTALLGADFLDFSGYIYVDRSGQISCISPRKPRPLSITGDTLSPASIIPAAVREMSAEKKPISHGQTNEISTQAFQNIFEVDEGMDVAQMYEAIIENL